MASITMAAMAALSVRSGSVAFARPIRSRCIQEVSANSSEQAQTPASACHAEGHGFELSLRSFEPAASLAAAAGSGTRADDLRLSPPHRLGTTAGRRGDRLRALDRLEGAVARGHLAAGETAEGAGQQLPVALSRRSAAHRHKPLHALPPAWTPRHPRPLPVAARPQRRRSATTSPTRSSTTIRVSPTSSSTSTRRRRQSPASSSVPSPSSPRAASSASG